MEASMLPQDLQTLLDSEVLRRVSGIEFVIDELRHQTRTWMGWNVVIYALRVEDGDEGRPLFEIVEETESLGEDIVLSSADSDEAAFWITEHIREKEK